MWEGLCTDWDNLWAYVLGSAPYALMGIVSSRLVYDSSGHHAPELHHGVHQYGVQQHTGVQHHNGLQQYVGEQHDGEK